MKKAIYLLVILALSTFSSLPACNLSQVSNSSMVQVGNQWRLIFQLDVGRGRTGTTTGGDGDTRTFSLAFWGAGTLISFSPATVTGSVTGCTNQGTSAGPLGPPFNSQNNIVYFDPGYYGYAPCVTTPFACIGSTASCGNVGVESNVFTIFFDCVPDSMRVFGVEGNGNPLAGCYPNTDMLLDFTSFSNSIICPGRQAVAADSNCQGFVPDVVSLATSACQISGYTQTPAIGSLIGGLGDSVLVYVHPTGLPPSSATCSLYVRVADLTGPAIQCPSNQVLFVDANCQFTVPNFSGATVVDNCDPSAAVTNQSPMNGAVLANSTTVLLTASDNIGNTDTCSFSLTASDTIAPVLNCPSTQQLYLNANCFASLFDYTSLVFAQDNCSSSVALTQSPGLGTAFSGLGTSTVTISGTDNSNNTSSCTFQVTRLDTMAPSITCPASQTVFLNANCQAVLPDLTLNTNVTDNCPGSIQVSQNPPAGTVINGPSTLQVTIAATDGSNTSLCSVSMIYVAGPLDTIMASTLMPCQGDTVSLSVTAGLSSYLWSTGSTTNSTDVTSTGWYWCDMNMGLACGGRDSIYVDFLPAPQPTVTANGNMFCVGAFSTYQWYRDSVLLVGETNMCINAILSGAYYCVVTDGNGCTGSSAASTFVGVDLGVSSYYSIYPVPAQDVLHLVFDQPIVSRGTISLYDMTGKLVFQQAMDPLTMPNSYAISLLGIASGNYLLEVKTAEFSGMRKVMKLE